MKRSWIVVLITAAALAGAAVAQLLTRADHAPPALERATLFEAPRPLPEFSLVDQRGERFGRERLSGHWTLLFFGFTHCPDVCPTTLATLAEARRRLVGLASGDIAEVVFASVDPGRDTPAVLAQYVAHFDRSFTGVTGDPKSMDTLTGHLGVAAMIGAAAADGSYTVDHTAAVFLIDPDAAYTAVFGAPHDAGAIARDYSSIVAARTP